MKDILYYILYSVLYFYTDKKKLIKFLAFNFFFMLMCRYLPILNEKNLDNFLFHWFCLVQIEAHGPLEYCEAKPYGHRDDKSKLKYFRKILLQFYKDQH